MSLCQLPPVIASLKRVLQDDYMRAGGNPLRRMNIILEHAKRFRLTAADYRALAVEEARYAYQNVGGLPEGEYRNGRGDSFTVDDWGKPSGISKTAPPAPNSVWIPRFHRHTAVCIPIGFHFILGAWCSGQNTPPLDASHSYPAGAVPAGLEGARYLGAMPPMPQHLQSSGYLSQVPAAVSNGQEPYVPAVISLQQPLTTADPSEQQHAATDPQEEQNSKDVLQSRLQQCLARPDAVEEPARQETQLTDLEESLLKCVYPGYAPARGYRGPPQ